MGQCHIYLYFFCAPTSTYLYLKDFKALCVVVLCKKKPTTLVLYLLIVCWCLHLFHSLQSRWFIWAMKNDRLRDVEVSKQNTHLKSKEFIHFSIVQLANIWPRRISVDYLDWTLFEFLFRFGFLGCQCKRNFKCGIPLPCYFLMRKSLNILFSFITCNCIKQTKTRAQ